MADASASFVLTARDSTGAAFRSADKNLKQFQRTATSVRSLLGAFGVALSARAFASWIRGATDATKLTEMQRRELEGTLKAMTDLKASSDELARSLATSLVPAMQTATKFAIGLNRALFGADPDPFEAELRALQSRRDDLNDFIKSIEDATMGMDPQLVGMREELGKVNAEIARLNAAQRVAFGFDVVPNTDFLTDDLKKELETATELLDLQDLFNPPDASFLTDALKAELETATDLLDLQKLFEPPEDGYFLTDELMAELETATELLDMQGVFEENKEAANDFAATFGRTLHDSAVDVFMGVGTNFKDLLKRMAADLAVSSIFSALSSSFGGTSFWGKVFGGFRANGGPVSAGKSYVVGERGPELFTPGMSGGITPSASGGGDVVYAPVYNIAAGVTRAELLPILQAHGSQLKADIRQTQNRRRW